jgi:hypothetical protein
MLKSKFIVQLENPLIYWGNIMRIMKICLLGLISGFVTQGQAASYVCKQGKAERKILLTYAGENKKMPCEVKYQKEGETEGATKWSAKTDSDFCEKKSDEFAEKLKGMNWVCEKQN